MYCVPNVSALVKHNYIVGDMHAWKDAVQESRKPWSAKLCVESSRLIFAPPTRTWKPSIYAHAYVIEC